MTSTKTLSDRLRDLSREYRPTMGADVMRAWGADIAPAALDALEELEGRSAVLTEWMNRLQAICEKQGALGGDNRFDFIEYILDSAFRREVELAKKVATLEREAEELRGWDRVWRDRVDAAESRLAEKDKLLTEIAGTIRPIVSRFAEVREQDGHGTLSLRCMVDTAAIAALEPLLTKLEAL